MMKKFATCAVVVSLLTIVATVRAERPADKEWLRDAGNFSLVGSMQEMEEPEEQMAMTAAEVERTDTEWEIEGPIFLRSADPEETGEIVIKNNSTYTTSSDGTDDDWEYEFEIEWGVVENHELIFELPINLGDGDVEGNGDATIGWHWRLWEEQDEWPAFAVRSYIRIPSGYHSEGVDGEIRGLLTKTIVPGKFRIHANPFMRTLNGDPEGVEEGNEGWNWCRYEREDRRHFQWGAALGGDYWLTDDLLFVADYVHESAEDTGTRNQHWVEADVDWYFAEDQILSVATMATLDGDSEGPNWGLMFSYILEFHVY